MHDAFFSEKVENLSIDIQEKYTELSKNNKNIDSNFIMPWEELSEDLKEFTRDQARNIPNALLKINYDLISVKCTLKNKEFTDRELDILAEHEHMRWYYDRKKADWKYDVNKNHKERTDPSLVPWDRLPKEKKDKVLQMVKIWPEILARSNFKLDELKTFCQCESKKLDISLN